MDSLSHSNICPINAFLGSSAFQGPKCERRAGTRQSAVQSRTFIGLGSPHFPQRVFHARLAKIPPSVGDQPVHRRWTWWAIIDDNGEPSMMLLSREVAEMTAGSSKIGALRKIEPVMANAAIAFENAFGYSAPF